MPKRPSFFRRKYLVNTKFQLEIIGYFILFYLVVVGILYYALTRSVTASAFELERISPGCAAAFELNRELQMQTLNINFLLFSNFQ